LSSDVKLLLVSPVAVSGIIRALFLAVRGVIRGVVRGYFLFVLGAVRGVVRGLARGTVTVRVSLIRLRAFRAPALRA
jgi:hypothetical protein